MMNVNDDDNHRATCCRLAFVMDGLDLPSCINATVQ